MLLQILALVLAFVAYNVGDYLEARCDTPRGQQATGWLRVCQTNAPLIKWFGILAGLIIVVFGTYEYVTRRR